MGMFTGALLIAIALTVVIFFLVNQFFTKNPKVPLIINLLISVIILSTLKVHSIYVGILTSFSGILLYLILNKNKQE